MEGARMSMAELNVDGAAVVGMEADAKAAKGAYAKGGGCVITPKADAGGQPWEFSVH